MKDRMNGTWREIHQSDTNEETRMTKRTRESKSQKRINSKVDPKKKETNKINGKHT